MCEEESAKAKDFFVRRLPTDGKVHLLRLQERCFYYVDWIEPVGSYKPVDDEQWHNGNLVRQI